MGVKNDTFWSKICSGFEDSGGTPPQEFPEVPTPGMYIRNFNNTHKYKKKLFGIYFTYISI